MSKLDEAFLKAYAKVRETGHNQKVEAPAAPHPEANEEVLREGDADLLLRADDGVVNVASFIARTSNGRTRGTARRPFGGVGEGSSPQRPPAPDFGTEPSREVDKIQIIDGNHVLQGPHFQPISLDLAALDVYAAAATMVADTRASGRSHVIHAATELLGAESLVAKPLATLAPESGLHRAPQRSAAPDSMSLDSLGYSGGHVHSAASEVELRVKTDQTPRARAVATSAPVSPELRIHQSHDLGRGATEGATEQVTEMVAEQFEENILEVGIPQLEEEEAELHRDGATEDERFFVRADMPHQPLADQSQPAELATVVGSEFVAAWEVDRFEFEDIVWELSAEASPLWQAAEQLEIACREGLKVLAITSPARGQGRSTLAITLARMLSATGLNVALLDGDIDRPSLADKMRLEIRLGWGDAVRTGLSVEEVAVQSVEDGFTVLPSATPDATKALRPAAEATGMMIGRLREAFDLIVIDTANVNVVGGWIPGADDCQIDAALVIQDLRNEDPDAMQACLRRLQKIGIANIGLVENFANA